MTAALIVLVVSLILVWFGRDHEDPTNEIDPEALRALRESVRKNAALARKRLGDLRKW